MEDEYRPVIPVPRISVESAVRRVGQRVFGGWRPDERTVGVILVAFVVGTVLLQLLTVDLAWNAFRYSALGVDASPLRPLPWQGAVGATLRLLSVPSSLVVLTGGVGLVLQRGWGRWVAVAGLAALVVIDVGNAVIRFSSLATAMEVRQGIGQLLYALGAALPIAVLLWSRPAPEDA